jgi:acetyltransferase
MTDRRPSLDRLFAPRSIAVVGASATPEKPGFQMLRALAPFPGAVYPVNPRGGDILGRTVYPRLADIPGPVDLIALLVPPQHSAAVLREAAAIGAGAAFMISGGFSETGADGRRLEDELRSICRESGIRLLGPNTSGFAHPGRRLFCTFLPAAQDFRAGRIGVVAQSGGINLTVAFMIHRAGLGMTLACGLGNAADVGIAEVVAYLAEDEATTAIALHVEGVPDGRTLYDAVAAATRKKPVIALPVGRADLGGFAESHTGKLIGDFALTRAALAQAGAVVVDDTQALVDAAQVLSLRRLAPKERPGIGILTGQAGPGLLMTDRLRSAGISVPEISPATVGRIAKLLPPMTYMRNPVDTGRPAESYAEVLATLAEDPAIDALIAWALLEDDSHDPVAAVRLAVARAAKPVVYGTLGADERMAEVAQALDGLGAPTYPSPDRAAEAARALVVDAAAAWRGRAAIGPRGATPSLPPGPIDEDAAKSAIEALGIPCPRRVACAGRAEAKRALRTLGGPVVVKVLDAAIPHKTEVGGVHVGVAGDAALAAAIDAIDAIPPPRARRYLVEEMAPPGVELILGAKNDASYGPTVLVGLGGIAAEAMRDVAVRLAPLGPAEAEAMIGELRGRALLDGFRGAPRCDRTALVRAIVRLGDLIAAEPAIREIDLNPLRLYPQGLLALDALIVR